MSNARTPVVTVVVPTYDRLEYLGPAIESALRQTYTDIEILVTDNGPSAAVAELVASYGDPRIRYRHNGGNIGPTLNALAAYREARGRFIGTLHDDDAWEPTLVERLLEPLERDSGVVAAYADHWIITRGGELDMAASERNTRVWRRDSLAEGIHRPFTYHALVDRGVPVAISTLFRKDAVDWDDFPAEMDPVYDLWLAYLLSRDGGGLYFCPARLSRYRVHQGSLTAQQRLDRAVSYCYRRFTADERLRPLWPALRRAGAHFHTGVGIALLHEGRRAEARHRLRGALAEGPELRGAVALGLSYLPGPGLRSLLGWSRRISSTLARHLGGLKQGWPHRG